MKTLTQGDFINIIDHATLKPRFKKELKFVASTAHMPRDWTDYEFVAISDRTLNKGILLLQPQRELYIVEYELTRRVTDSLTGRDRAIICDFCYTWQSGSNAASITFLMKGSNHNTRLLCCADLRCSQHVRTRTKAAISSRSQLRENLDDNQRIDRLKDSLLLRAQQLSFETVLI